MTVRWADPDRPTLRPGSSGEGDPRWFACPVCGLGKDADLRHFDATWQHGAQDLSDRVRGWPAHPLCADAARGLAGVEPRPPDRRMPGHTRLLLAGVMAVTLLLFSRAEWSAAFALAGTTAFLILVGLIPEPPTTTGRTRR